MSKRKQEPPPVDEIFAAYADELTAVTVRLENGIKELGELAQRLKVQASVQAVWAQALKERGT